MAASFFEQPVLNNPYEPPGFHHALDDEGQPLDVPPIVGRRGSSMVTPVPMRTPSGSHWKRSMPAYPQPCRP